MRTTGNDLHTHLVHQWQVGKQERGAVFTYRQETAVLGGETGMFSNVGRLYRGAGAEAGGELSTGKTYRESDHVVVISHSGRICFLSEQNTRLHGYGAETHTSVRSSQVLQCARNYHRGRGNQPTGLAIADAKKLILKLES